MNGVMHFSVLDGWWVEGYQPGCGWALPLERTYDDQNYQNELDAATIYATIENEIAPIYYKVNPETGRSSEWIGYIKNTIAKVASNFTTNRMLEDYCKQYYVPQSERYERISADDNKIAREIAVWKDQVRAEWNNIRIVSYARPDSSYVLSIDDPLKGEVVLDLGRLKPEDIGVEMVFASADDKGKLHIRDIFELQLAETNGAVATYRTTVLPERTGMYQVGTRIYPKNPELPHRQDFPLVKWL